MGNNVIAYLQKKSTLTETLTAASEKVEKMDLRAAERAKKQASGDAQTKRKLPKNFLDSFRVDLDAKREKKETDLSSDLLVDPVPDPVVGQGVKQVSNLLNDLSDNLSDDLSDDPTVDLSQYLVGDNSFNINMKERPLDLTERQYITLHYIYFNRPFKVTGKKGISSILAMGDNNARNQVKSLKRKGYIFKPYRVNIGATNYSTCRVNGDRCVDIFGPTNISNPQLKPGNSDPSNNLSGDLTGDISNDPSVSLNSSSSFNKKTTTQKKMDLNKIQRDLEHPALANWVKWGLRVEQISMWLKSQPEVSINDILISLRHVEFQFLDQGYLKDREDKGNPIRDYISWFWGTFKERGYFIPEPNGYVSWEKKRIIQITAAKEKLINEQEALLCLQLGDELDKILAQPESDEFNQVFSQLDKYLQKRYKRPESQNTETFRMSMMNALKKLRGCE